MLVQLLDPVLVVLLDSLLDDGLAHDWVLPWAVHWVWRLGHVWVLGWALQLVKQMESQ